jgi:integrase
MNITERKQKVDQIVSAALEQTTTQPLDYDFALRILARLKGQDRLLWALMLFTGRRYSDVSRIMWEDVKRDVIYLKEKKTSKRCKIIINDKLREVLDKYIPTDGYVLAPAKYPMQKLTIQGANFRLKAIAEKQGITGITKMSTHMLRKTFSKAIYDRHGIDVLSQMLNHDSQRTTRRYIGLTEQALDNAYKSL